MRFPLRFTSDFRLGVTSRVMRARWRGISFINLASDARIASLPPISSLDSIVWIGGSEPLQHCEVPSYTNELAAAGRDVFLQTDGTLLRRRIHEFRPTSRFRFVLKFDPQQPSGNVVAFEAIRAAKLCGFLICALTQLDDPAQLDALSHLHRGLHRLDLDGYMIVPATRSTALDGALTVARHQMLNRRWRRLSAMVDSAIAPAPATQTKREVRQTSNPLVRPQPLDPDWREGAQA